MSQSKVFKKGEVIFKEGDKSGALYFIQSGQVQVFLQRPKQKIELYKLGSNQILAEQVLAGSQAHSASAMALIDTTVLEFSSENIKMQIEGLNQVTKLIVKSSLEKLKQIGGELKSARMEKDNTPCPQDQTAKVFGSIFHSAHHKGEKKEDRVSISWLSFKQYAQRVFGENPKRLESAVNILVKIKLAEYEMEETPEDGLQIGFVHFFDLRAVENFFEFYQHYYFKGGKLELFKVDDNSARIVTNLLEIAKAEAVDRKGAVKISFESAIEKFKSQHQMNLNADHFAVLEQKGLFAQRKSQDNGVFLSFDMREWQNMLMNWRILKEIDKWNEKTFVDINEPEESFSKKTAHVAQLSCPECQASLKEEVKFCPNCGHKIAKAA